MPELPEVETVRRGLEPAMTGARIAGVELRRPDLRFPFPEGFAKRLQGRTIAGMGRRAKYLTADLDDGTVLVMHLGMSGSFRVLAPGEQEAAPGAFRHARGRASAHDHVRFALSGGVRIVYNDPRRFGFMTLVPHTAFESHPLFRHLGVEPTGNRLNAAYLAAGLAGRRTSLKAALMDQRLIAGVGNIYASEALHRARLSPRRTAASVASPRPGGRADRLAAAVRDVIAEAIAAGGSTLRDHVLADGTLGRFQHAFGVYDRAEEPCPRPGCDGTIARIVQSARASYFCPRCQR